MEQGSTPVVSAQTLSASSDTYSSGSLEGGTALDKVQLEQAIIEPGGPNPDDMLPPPPRRRWWLFVVIGVVLIVVAVATIFWASKRNVGQTLFQSNKFDVITLPLSGLEQAKLSTQTAQLLQINGSLQVAGSITLTPGSEPKNPQSGQIYYDKTGNKLSYFNGQAFVPVADGNVISDITDILSGIGEGVQLQAASPGTQQIGNFNISGTGTMGTGVIGTVQTTVIDSKGGTLYINPVGATAQQTVSAGTPASTGLNTVGSIAAGPGWANDLVSTKVNLGSVGGTATSISVYFESVTPGDRVQVGLYEDDGDIPSKPANLLAASAVTTLNGNGFTTVTIPSVNLNANATYWLTVNTDSATAVRTYNGGSKNSCFVSRIFGFMPDPFSAFGCFYDDNVYAIYLNYLSGAGASGSLSQSAMVIGPTGQVLFQNSEDSTTALRIQNSSGTNTIFNVDTTNGRVAIGKTTANFKLDIAAGDINLSNGRSLRFGGLQVFSVNGSGTTTSISNFIPGGKVSVQASAFVVQDADATHQSISVDSDGAAIFSNKNNSPTAFRIQNADASATVLNVDTTGRIVTVSNLVSSGNITVSGHIITGGSTPVIAAGAAACTTPTVSVAGNDISGTITVTAGTGCASSGTLATLTFATVYGAAPRVILTPGTANALTLGAYVDNATTTTTGFSIGTNTTPSNSTTYRWNYIVLQ